MAKARSKRREDDDLSALIDAVDKFDVAAPLGTYQLDRVSDELRGRIRSHDPYRATRLLMLRCCRRSLREKHHSEVIHPEHEKTAQQFIDELSAIVNVERRLSNLDRDHLGTILHRYPSPDDSDQFSAEFMVSKIDDETATIVEITRKLSSQINEFLDRICIPDFEREGNRSVRFTRTLIAQATTAWFEMVGYQPNRDDVPDLSNLVFATLIDFKYPLQETQRGTVLWLTDRIRKQIFGN
jgi:hypothetical protein